MGGWRTRSVAVPVRMETVRGMWSRAWRVDAHNSDRLGTRSTTIVLGEPDSPIGWLAVRWRLPKDGLGLIHRIGWDESTGRSQLDVWRAVAELAGEPVLQAPATVQNWVSPSAA
jgi:hypothetical protein